MQGDISIWLRENYRNKMTARRIHRSAGITTENKNKHMLRSLHLVAFGIQLIDTPKISRYDAKC